VAFCSHCFCEVHLWEIVDDAQPDYFQDLRVLRVMVSKPTTTESLGKTPRERRLRRKELGLPPLGRGGPFIPALDRFQHNGDYLYYSKSGGTAPDLDQAACPHCHTANAIVLGFSENEPPCPKCQVGVVIAEYFE